MKYTKNKKPKPAPRKRHTFPSLILDGYFGDAARQRLVDSFTAPDGWVTRMIAAESLPIESKDTP